MYMYSEMELLGSTEKLLTGTLTSMLVKKQIVRYTQHMLKD